MCIRDSLQTTDSITPADDYVVQIEGDDADEHKAYSDDAHSDQTPISSQVENAVKPPSKQKVAINIESLKYFYRIKLFL
mgnify:CR=1 FL=1